MIKLITLLAASIIYLNTNAQQTEYQLDSVITAHLNKKLKSKLYQLKDSNNLYSFAIKIELTRLNSKAVRIDSISTNDKIMSKLLFGDINELRTINWNSYFRSDKKLKIVKPVSIQIGQKTHHNLTTSDLFNLSCRLFYIGSRGSDKISAFNTIILPPFVTSFDLKIYD